MVAKQMVLKFNGNYISGTSECAKCHTAHSGNSRELIRIDTQSVETATDLIPLSQGEIC